MSQKKISKKIESAFTRLLDDDSPTVHQVMLEELKRLDNEGINFLEKILEEQPDLSTYARRYLREIRGPDPTEKYIEFIHSLNYELETGLLMLNRTIDSNVDVAFCCSQIDVIAERCSQLILPASTALEKCRVINRVFFYEYGFRRGDTTSNDSRENLIAPALLRRRGSALILTILYVLIAQRCRLQLEPVQLPGYFIAGCFVDKIPFFINPFENGVFLSAKDLQKSLSAQNIKLTPSMLFPISIGEVLSQCCLALATQYEALKESKSAKLFERFAKEFERVFQQYADRQSS